MQKKSTSDVWVRFLASPEEALANLKEYKGITSRYRVRDVVSIKGQAPKLKKGWSLLRVETSTPLSFSQFPSPNSPSVIQYYGVAENLHYTSEAQRRELDKHSVPELEPSDQTTAVLIPILKSEEWWKLAQDQRQSYFEKTGKHKGHTAIGLKYVDRVFRKLYHSRYLNAAMGYDFLTYFEFKDIHEKDFRTLLAELRDTKKNPEWAFVNYEHEIWMTKIE